VASSVLFVTAHPIFVGIGSHFLLKERVGRRLLGGIALSIIGGIVIGWGDLQIGGAAIYGDLLALLFFGEVPGWLNGIGAVIILSGIYLSLKSEEESDGNGDRSGEDRMG